MEAVIHRVRMAGCEAIRGMAAYSYEVYVQADCLPVVEGGVTTETVRGYTVHQIEGFRKLFVPYEVATFACAEKQGPGRWQRWKQHRETQEAAKLRLVQTMCPETRHLRQWPQMWTYVPPPESEEVSTLIHVRIPKGTGVPQRISERTAAGYGKPRPTAWGPYVPEEAGG